MESKDRQKAFLGYGLFSVVLLLCTLPFAGSNLHSHFMREITLTVAAPFWIALILVLSYGGLLWIRGFQQLGTTLSVLLVLAAFCHPQRLVFEPALQTIWPLLLLVAFQTLIAIRAKSLERWMLLVSAACSLTWFSIAKVDLILAWFISLQLLWSLSLLIGLLFHGPRAIWIRLISVGVLLISSIAITASVPLIPTNGLIAAATLIGFQLILLTLWTFSRWPLLFRAPLFLIPLIALSIIADVNYGLGGVANEQSVLLMLFAASCFGIGFLISAGKAGWLSNFTHDFTGLFRTIKSELMIYEKDESEKTFDQIPV